MSVQPRTALQRFAERIVRYVSYRRFVRRTHIDLHRRFRTIFGWLALLLALNTVAMMVFEKMNLSNAIWLTLTTVTTVGYGDYSAHTLAGRLATIFLIYIAGIALVAQLASEYFDLRAQRKNRMIEGRWEWNMRDHLLIIHSPTNNAESYFLRLVSQLRDTREYADTPVLILTEAFPSGLPSELRELGVVHRNGNAAESDELAAATPNEARAVILLARDEYSRISDSINLDVLLQIAHHHSDALAHTLVECVNDSNRQRYRNIGARAVLRPGRAYPEILVRALVAPGAESMMDTLFRHYDTHAMRYDIEIKDRVWSDIACVLMRGGLGTLMAYQSPDEEIVTHPAYDHRVNAKALILIVRAENTPTEAQVRDALAEVDSPPA